MIRRLSLAVVAALMFTGCTTPPNSTAAPKPVQSWSVPLASLPASTYKLLVVGASNTESGEVTRTNFTRWHDIVADRRATQRGTSVTRVRYTGEIQGTGSLLHLDNGYSGVSAVALAAYPEVSVPAAVGADELWLLLGSNDEALRYTPDRYGKALDTLVKRYGAQRCTVIAPWANANFGYYNDRPAHELYVAAAEKAAADNGCTYLRMDLIGPASGPNGIGDGVHLSTAGHTALANQLTSVLGL